MSIHIVFNVLSNTGLLLPQTVFLFYLQPATKVNQVPIKYCLLRHLKFRYLLGIYCITIQSVPSFSML